MASRHVFGAWIAGLSILLLSLFTGFHAFGQATVGPKFILRESEPDKGEVWEGQIIARDVRILNQGDQQLEIKRIETGCGCTAATFDRFILPGKEGRIEIRVDTRGILGALRENVKVHTNDPERPLVILTVTAFVKPAISLSQRYINFYAGEGRRMVKEVEIKAEMEKPLKLTPAQFNLDGKMTYQLEEIEKGKTFRVRFENIPGPAENFRGFLKLRTNYREKPEVTIWIWGRISGKG